MMSSQRKLLGKALFLHTESVAAWCAPYFTMQSPDCNLAPVQKETKACMYIPYCNLFTRLKRWSGSQSGGRLAKQSSMTA